MVRYEIVIFYNWRRLLPLPPQRLFRATYALPATSLSPSRCFCPHTREKMHSGAPETFSVPYV